MAITRTRAEFIQIGDEVKPASLTRFAAVEAVADHGGAYPYRVFLLDDGSTIKGFVGAYIPHRKAA